MRNYEYEKNNGNTGWVKYLYIAEVAKWGKQAQQIMATEEMAELTKEISKNIRGYDNLDEIAEEIADVEIMLEQLAGIHGLEEKVENWKKKKLKRLDKVLEEEE